MAYNKVPYQTCSICQGDGWTLDDLDICSNCNGWGRVYLDKREQYKDPPHIGRYPPDDDI